MLDNFHLNKRVQSRFKSWVTKSCPTFVWTQAAAQIHLSPEFFLICQDVFLRALYLSLTVESRKCKLKHPEWGQESLFFAPVLVQCWAHSRLNISIAKMIHTVDQTLLYTVMGTVQVISKSSSRGQKFQEYYVKNFSKTVFAIRKSLFLEKVGYIWVGRGTELFYQAPGYYSFNVIPVRIHCFL